ncbi:MAG: CPBP family intramembrane metalloprotease [Deltaproteobacteria bacterium]|nr:CPBP family intramembrane metalloprotease [Deltaproteobacteria bacterium]
MQDETAQTKEKPNLNAVRSAAMLACVAAFGLGRLWQVPLTTLILALAGAMVVLALLFELRLLRSLFAFSLRDVLFALAVGILVYVLLSWARRVLPDVMPISGLWLGRLASRASAVPVWLAGPAGAIVLVPAEELFWRGFVLRRLAVRLGPVAGVTIAAAAYAIFWTAALDPLVGGAAALCGLAFGVMTVRSKSLVPAMAGHALLWILAVSVMPLYR